MRVGIYLPQIGPAASQKRVVETAQAAEAAGFDSLWVLDHVVLREDYGTPYPYDASGRLRSRLYHVRLNFSTQWLILA